MNAFETQPGHRSRLATIVAAMLLGLIALIIVGNTIVDVDGSGNGSVTAFDDNGDIDDGPLCLLPPIEPLILGEAPASVLPISEARRPISIHRASILRLAPKHSPPAT